jgi:hypothetical protein
VYDSQGLVFGARVRPGGTCDGNPCWKRSSPEKLQYQSKLGNTFGVSQMKLAAGPAGKASIRVKAKSKVGNFVAPHGMPLTGPVISQLLISEGFDSRCFETTFSAISKNDPKQFSAKGP